MTGLDHGPSTLAQDETIRLTALDSYGILDTPAEQGFDDIVLLATQLCETPVALVSLVAAGRLWFKARIGFDAAQTPLAQSVCAHTIRQSDLLIIPDLTADPRTRDNTLVTGAPHIRFYAGAPLRTPEGQAIGALCVIDTRPRPEGLMPVQAQALQALARQVMTQLELRRSMATLRTRIFQAGREGWTLALEAAGLAQWELDLRSHAVARSLRHDQIFGYAALQPRWSYEIFLDHVVPADRAVVDAGFNAALSTGGLWEFDCCIVTARGSKRWLWGKAQIQLEADGAPRRMLGIIGDQTAQRLQEHERQRLASIAENSSDFICCADADGNPIFLNRAGRELVGIDRDFDIRQTAITDFFVPEQRSFVASTVLGAVRNQGRWAGELMFRHFGTGERIPVLYDLFRVDDPASGAAVNFATVTRDITAAKTAEVRLRDLNANLERQVQDQIRTRTRTWEVNPQIMGVINMEGYFEQSNPAWKAILGWSEQEVRTTRFLDFIHPDDLARTSAAWDAAVLLGQPALRFENRYRHKDDGWRWLSWVAIPEGGKIYCSGRDITEDKAREAELQEAQEALRQSQKMEAIGQLTGGIAHDFNNLLTGISGSLELLQARVLQGRVSEVDRYVVAAQGAARRAAALTHRLLAFSRRQTLDPRPTDVNRLVAGMEDLIRRTVGPEIAVETVAADGLWNTLADPGQLENALLNLCINARDAMPGGGRLTIETANRRLDDRSARERGMVAGEYVSLCVSDNGAGMPSETVARAFDPFFTTKPIGMGTGLGLSMVYGFVQQSGGQARIDSELGRGTRVCLDLPRHHGDAEPAETAAKPLDVPRSQQHETVLVVDDEPTVRMLMIDVLEELGYAAIEAADGGAGLQALQSGIPIELLITDVGLPGGMNGRQLADAARATQPDLKVLFITGYADNAVLNHGHLDPGMHIMTKPFSVDALASRIRDLFASG